MRLKWQATHYLKECFYLKISKMNKGPNPCYNWLHDFFTCKCQYLHVLISTYCTRKHHNLIYLVVKKDKEHNQHITDGEKFLAGLPLASPIPEDGGMYSYRRLSSSSSSSAI